MLTRRRTLALGAGLALWPRGALAARTQVTGVQRRTVGDLTVTALLDGHLDLDPAEVLTGVDAEAIPGLLERAFLAGDAVATAVNAYVVESGERTLLVDGGAGDAFGPSAGHLLDALAASGVAPEAVDTVFCTHLHPDHIGAFTTADGGARFANAELVVHESERAFWSDAGNFADAGEMMRDFAALAQGALAAYPDRTRTIVDGADVAPGITARHLPGHTPGHTGLVLDSNGETLLLWGDVVHIGPVQFPRPAATIAFDVDPARAAATRRALFDEVAAERLMIAGSHVSFPSFGHLERRGDGFAFAPARWQYEL
jgi:glyoxylase-like metal-dependent hydrolase (beta-lactamase superfamily II)